MDGYEWADPVVNRRRRRRRRQLCKEREDRRRQDPGKRSTSPARPGVRAVIVVFRRAAESVENAEETLE